MLRCIYYCALLIFLPYSFLPALLPHKNTFSVLQVKPTASPMLGKPSPTELTISDHDWPYFIKESF